MLREMKTKSLIFSPFAALLALLCAPVAVSAQSILLSAGNYALLAKTTITNTGPTVITGNIGLSPGTSITGFIGAPVSGPGVVTGSIIIGGASAQAILDLGTASVGLAKMPVTTVLPSTELGGLTLPPGVYKLSAGAVLDGALKLDAQGQNDAYWVFQITTTLTTNNISSVTIINPGTNGGSDDGIFWNVSTAVTFNGGSQLLGNYLAGTSVTYGGAVSGNGRTLALAAVTLDSSTDNSNGGPGGSDYTGGLQYDPITGNVVSTPPIFSTQPVNQAVTTGSNATYIVAASNGATFQWQRQPFGNLTYANITNGSTYSGTNTTTLLVSNTTLAMSGDQFRAVASNFGGNVTSTSALLTVTTPLPVFTTQPSDQAVVTGANTTYSVAASNGATYQWQREPFGTIIYSNLTNAGAYSNVTTAILTVSNATLAMSGDQFRAVATNLGGSTTSTSALMTVTTALPIFSTQPSNQVVATGANTTFAIVANGGATIQWQREAFGTLTYSNLTNTGAYSNVTGTVLGVSNATLAMSGDQFRAVATNLGGSTTSTSASLTVSGSVTPLPVFTTQPINQAVTTGANTTFTVLATGGLTYQWQREPFGTIVYSDLTNTGAYSNVTGTVLSVSNATLVMSGDQFRAIATNDAGNTTSTSALLTVTTALPVFSTQPIDQAVVTGANTTFAVLASGGATYQWQREPFGTIVFANLTNTGAYSNVTGTVLSVSNATLAMSGDTFQAVATNSGGSTTSTSALLTVTTALPIFSLQPVNQSVITGSNATFAALANGNATYQWQREAFGNLTYANLTNTGGYSNVTGTVLSVSNTTFVMSGDQFRVIAKNLGGSTTSTSALLTVAIPVPVITGQPANQVVVKGGSTTFTAGANGGATYQWQVLTPGAGSYANLTNNSTFAGVTSATLSISNATLAMSGDLFRAVATNGGGSTLTSAASLTVSALPIVLKITVQPVAATGWMGEGVQFQVVAIGSGPITYAWERNNVKLVNSARVHQAKSATLTLTNLGLISAGKYRVVVTNSKGFLNSTSVQLTVLRKTIPAIH